MNNQAYNIWNHRVIYCSPGNYILLNSLLLLVFIILSVSTTCNAIAESSTDPFPLNRYTLDNGMKIWCQPRSDSRSVIIYAVVNVGSRYEDETNNGISHFIEHMVFTGTEKWDESEIKNFITKRGGKWNGFTGREKTYYYVETASDDFEYALD